MNGRFTFNQEELMKILKVFAWTMASAGVAALISVVGIIEMPPEYVWVVPIINTALYGIQKFVSEHQV